MPEGCPECGSVEIESRLRCTNCGHEVQGEWHSGRLVNLPEPHATLLEQFLRVRGNMKEMERELGLAYSTVRARLEEAFAAVESLIGPTTEERQQAVLDQVSRGEISPSEAIQRLRELRLGGQRAG